MHEPWFNPLGSNQYIKLNSVIHGWGIISCGIGLRLMPLDLINDKSTLVQVMAWCYHATSHYLSQCWPRSLSPYGVTRPQWVNIVYLKTFYTERILIRKLINLLWPSDTIWRHRSGSTVAYVMAWCLTTPSHYLNQCWLIISKVQWHSCEGMFQKRYLNYW